MGLDVKLVESKVKDVVYQFYETTTVCFIKADCGAIFVGESHCFDINDYKIKEGKDKAYNNAFNKLLEAEAYHQKCVMRMLTEFHPNKPEEPKSGGVRMG